MNDIIASLSATSSRSACAGTNRSDKRGVIFTISDGVFDGSPENKAFFEATPAASLKLSTYKEDHFRPGKSYYIDISPAED